MTPNEILITIIGAIIGLFIGLMFCKLSSAKTETKVGWMEEINNLEKEISKLIPDINFTLIVNSKYLDKTITVCIQELEFKSTSDNFDGASRAVYYQLKGYFND